MLIVAAQVTWPEVVLGSVTTLGSIVAATLAFLNQRNMRTPSGQSIGKAVEQAKKSACEAAEHSAAIRNGDTDHPPTAGEQKGV